MPAEVEAKFRAADAATLEALAAAERLGRARLGPATTFDEVDRYLDTADGRLARAGWACRLRDRGSGLVASLKGPAAESGRPGVHRRPELEGPASASTDPATWPPSDARDALLRLSGDAPLAERLRLVQRRTERAVTLDERRIGTLSLDVVRAARGASAPVSEAWHVVELELAVDDAASVEALDGLAAELARWPGLVADPRTKLAHALAAVEGQTTSDIS